MGSACNVTGGFIDAAGEGGAAVGGPIVVSWQVGTATGTVQAAVLLFFSCSFLIFNKNVGFASPVFKPVCWKTLDIKTRRSV